MADKNANGYPMPSVMRLPVYLKFAKELLEQGKMIVSCTKIAKRFGQSPVQVRKDLALTSVVGRPRIGYQLDDLICSIESFLGWDRKIPACLVGVGGLGSAVLGYSHFFNFGLEIKAAFDSDPHKIGTVVHGQTVNDVSLLEEIGRREHIEVGVMTVPPQSAQEVAEKLVEIGVRGIWNFTPHHVELPSQIICENVRLSASFALLSSKLKNLSDD